MFVYKSFLVTLLTLSTTSLYSIDANHISKALHTNFQIGKPAKIPLKHSSHLTWQEVTMPTEERPMFIINMKESDDLFAYSWDSYGHPSPGLLHSSDLGAHWSNVSLPGSVPVWDMVSLDATHLAVINQKGVYISSDKGVHWNKTKDGSFKQIVAIDANTVFLVANGAEIYRSIDGGKSWEPASLNLPKRYKYFWYLAAMNDLLVINVNGEKADALYFSTNRGDYWFHPNSEWKFDRIAAVAVNSKRDVFVHAGGHLYKTDIYGKYKIQLDAAIPEYSYEAVIKIDEKDRIYYLIRGFPARLYRSEDNGNTWDLLQSFEADSKYSKYEKHVDTFNILQDGKIAATSGFMTLLSDDSQHYFSPILSMPVQHVVNIAKVKSELFLATSSARYGVHNLYQSQEDVFDWKLNRKNVYSIADLNGQLMIVDGERKALLSRDEGQNWEETAKFDYSMNLSSSKTRVWATTPDYDEDTSFRGGFVSSNGQDWQTYFKKHMIHGLYAEEEILYLTNGKALNKSKDNGQNWKNILTLEDSTRVRLRGYASHLLLLAVNKAGLIKSMDGGKTWNFINHGLNNWYFQDLVILDAHHYVVVNELGVFVTKDCGKSWEAANQGLKSLNVQRLFYKDNVLYASTEGSGVYKAIWK